MAIFRGSGSASSTSDQATIDEVTQQATNAASSATSAASSASSAASSASSASSSASTATTQASNASTSATNAASSASSASTSASNASTSATAAASSATTASSAETAATTAKTAAEAAQVAAESAQTAAESAETTATASASTASTAATTATTKASEASASATTASSAATAAESARDSTLAAFDSFDDRYLGSKTTDPTLDNDGNALVGGALYFNSVDEVMKVYTGSQWVAAYADVSGALLAVNNLSDLNNATSARTNLGLGTAATTASTDYATAAQGTLADSAVQPSDNISTLTNDSGYITDYTVTQGDVTAHQAALSITESQISDLQNYLTSETFTSVVQDTTPQLGGDLNTNGNAITGSTVAINGSNGEFMISATENGPVALRYDNNLKFSTKSDGVNITGEIEADSLDIDGNGDISGNLTLGGNLNLGDNDKAQFGASNDLQIYHDGSNSYIDNSIGNLYIRDTDYNGDIYIQPKPNENAIVAYSNSSVNLFYDNSQKLVTTSTGIDVTGEITADGIALGDSEKATFGASDDLQIFHSGGNSHITDAGTGNLNIQANELVVLDAPGTETKAVFTSNGSVELYYDNAKKLATTSTGIDVTGTVTTDTARSADVVDNDGSFDLDAGTNFTCTPTGNITLTFTNIPDGQSGTIVLVNTGGHTISAASTTKVMGADMLTTITTAGTYVIGYISDGTNVRVYNSGAQQ